MNGSWYTIFASSASVYLGIGVGSTVRWLNWLTEEADHSLLRLTVRVLYPCLIFSVVKDSPALKQPGNLLLPPLVGFGTMALGMALALAVARLRRGASGLNDAPQQRTFATCVGIFNYGFVPIPLIKMLYDDQTLGVLMVHNLGCELAVWTLAVTLLRGSLGRRWWQSMLNAPSITIGVALVVNFLNAGQCLPLFVERVIEWLGESSVPLSLILIGAIVADEIKGGAGGLLWINRVKIIAWSLLLRLLLLPSLFLLVAWLLPCSLELKRVIVVMAAMPSGTFPIVMARHYGGDPAVALRVAMSTSLVSLLTIPLWITFGTRLLHLAP